MLAMLHTAPNNVHKLQSQLGMSIRVGRVTCLDLPLATVQTGQRGPGPVTRPSAASRSSSCTVALAMAGLLLRRARRGRLTAAVRIVF